MRILGISGSLRRHSYNTALLWAVARLLPPPGAVFVVFDQLKALPPFAEDDEPAPGAIVEALREAITSADAVVIATPEYNASIPGVLKNALDWASRPASEGALLNKPVAVIGASSSMFGAVWAQAEARKVLRASGARVVDRELPVARAATALTVDGRLADPDLEIELCEILAELRSLVPVYEELAGGSNDLAAGQQARVCTVAAPVDYPISKLRGGSTVRTKPSYPMLASDRSQTPQRRRHGNNS